MSIADSRCITPILAVVFGAMLISLAADMPGADGADQAAGTPGLDITGLERSATARGDQPEPVSRGPIIGAASSPPPPAPPAQAETGSTISPSATQPDSAAASDVTSAIVPVATVGVPGAEIIGYDVGQNMLIATCAHGIALIHLGDGRDPVLVRTVDPRRPGWAGEATHVAVDPSGRGVAAVTLTPADRAGRVGEVAFLSVRTGRVLSRVEVGYCPDAAAFTADGGRVVIANEGEAAVDRRGVLTDPPGSVSIIDLEGVVAEGTFAHVEQADVRTLYFDGRLLADATRDGGDGRRGVRIRAANRWSPSLDLEPESIAIAGDRAYVTLQENNAIAIVDVGRMTIERIAPLGAIDRLLDPSDTDDRVAPWLRMPAMPMPDMLATIEIDGNLLLVTANEGDARAELAPSGEADPLADTARLATLADLGILGADDVALAAGPGGRLKVCTISGRGRDGLIGPTALGARSVTVWDADVALLGDTGSALEAMMADRCGAWFNADAGATGPATDTRSDDRGPEPEGIVAGFVGGRPMAFVTLERPGAVAAIDLSTPAEPRVESLHLAAAEGHAAPEGIALIPASRSPTGDMLLAVAFEVSGDVVLYEWRAPSSPAPGAADGEGEPGDLEVDEERRAVGGERGPGELTAVERVAPKPVDLAARRDAHQVLVPRVLASILAADDVAPRRDGDVVRVLNDARAR